MALIKTKAELRAHLPVAYANLDSKMPMFEKAEERYLLPILGQTLYDNLTEAYNNDGLNPLLTALLMKCRAVIAPLAYVTNIPFMQGMITDNGLLVTEDEKSRKAFKWEYNEVMTALTNEGNQAIESLIVYLTNHLVDFEDWAESDYNTEINFAFIRNGKDFRDAYPVKNPHSTYMMVKPLFEEIAELSIKPAISNEFFNDLSEKIKEQSFNASEKDVIRQIRMIAARLVMWKASITMSISFDEFGFTVIDGTSARDTAQEGKKDVSDARLLKFSEESKKSADALLGNLIKYLNANASEELFSSYFSSDKYVNPSDNKTYLHENGKRKGIFSF